MQVSLEGFSTESSISYMAKALNVPTSALYKACTLYVLGSIGYVGML